MFSYNLSLGLFECLLGLIGFVVAVRTLLRRKDEKSITFCIGHIRLTASVISLFAVANEKFPSTIKWQIMASVCAMSRDR